jgi:hypothetical protein
VNEAAGSGKTKQVAGSRRDMSLPRDVLLFSIVLMLWAIQIEASGYGTSNKIVLASVVIGLVGLLGSFVASLNAAGRRPESDAAE